MPKAHQRFFVVVSRIVILFIFTFVGVFFASKHSVRAYTFKRDVDVKISIINDTTAKVTQTHTLSWDNPTFYFPASNNQIYVYITPAYKSQEKDVMKRVNSLSVKNENGTNISFKKVVDDGAILLKIPYYKNLESYSDLTFKISYETEMYTSFEGNIMEVVYPGLSKDFQTSVKEDSYYDKTAYSVTVQVPQKYGDVSSFPTASNISTKNSMQNLTFGTSKLIGSSLRISAGNERLIKFSLKGNSYSTNSNSPDFVKDILVNYIDIALPTSQEGTEFSNQEVYYTKIQPFPESITRDEDGNMIARLPVHAANDEEIIIEGYAIIKKQALPEEIKKYKITDIPNSMSTYLLEEPVYWQTSSPQIQSIANENIDSGEFQYITVRNSLKKVSSLLKYANVASEADLVRQGAAGALESGIGVCMEYSDLLLSVLRAQGIPARAVYGDGLGSRVDRTLEGVGHQWVGVWFPDAGWIPVEPTWSDEGYLRLGHDLDHFTWYVASKSVNEPLGFDCQTLDSTYPCRDAIKINTEPVSELPSIEEMQTISQIQSQITKKSIELTPMQRTMQNIVNSLGTSIAGRILLSKQGLLITFALIIYIILVSIISVTVKAVRKRKQKNENNNN